MRARGEFVVDFSIGDPREPTPPFIPAALKAAVPAVSQYPTVPGLPELRRAVAAYVKRRFGVEVNPNTEVLPTAGSKEATFTTPLALITPNTGQAIVFGTPGYPVYERGARFAGADAVAIPLTGDFVLRAGDIPGEVWRRTAAVWICSPHNPTGSITSAADLAGPHRRLPGARRPAAGRRVLLRPVRRSGSPVGSAGRGQRLPQRAVLPFLLEALRHDRLPQWGHRRRRRGHRRPARPALVGGGGVPRVRAGRRRGRLVRRRPRRGAPGHLLSQAGGAAPGASRTWATRSWAPGPASTCG